MMLAQSLATIKVPTPQIAAKRASKQMDFSLGITAAKAAWETLNLAVKARDEVQIASATLELRTQLFAMSDTAMAYVERNAQLTQENATLKLEQIRLEKLVAELEQQTRENEQYVLHEFPTGTLAMRYEPAVQPSQKPMHYLCLACKHEGKHTVLQPQGKTSILLICQVNKGHNIYAQFGEAAPARRILSRGVDLDRWG